MHSQGYPQNLGGRGIPLYQNKKFGLPTLVSHVSVGEPLFETDVIKLKFSILKRS